jgi:hypothetical protein
MQPLVKVITTNWEQLSQLLPNEQKEQLAQLILARLLAGWVSVEIEFKDHHIKAFREVNSIPAKRPTDGDSGKST